MVKDQSYFMRRAAQERSAADHASDASARHAHLELERRYRELVDPPLEAERGDPAPA